MNYSKHFHIKLIILAFFVFFLEAPSADAMVTGKCSSCHTMHDSQNNTTMKLDSTPVTGSGSSECYDCHAQLRPTLLRLDCLGCHAVGFAETVNIVSGTPQIVHSDTPDLAAGNFKYVFGDDTFGHNVHGFPSAAIGIDSNNANSPPGYDADFDPSTGGYQVFTNRQQIMCAGQNGCHGNREEVSQTMAIRGSHHADDSVLQYGAPFNLASQGATSGTSYRYLLGVKGAEDDDWEDTTGATDHNEYIGEAYASRTSQAWADIQTMSSFCAECHGLFHSSAGLQDTGVWVRHPTDAVMPSDLAYFDGGGPYAYDLLTPVARPTITAGATQATGTVTADTDIVFCLSCHRSHASPYTSMLRWDYDTCVGDDPACGCYTCHGTTY